MTTQRNGSLRRVAPLGLIALGLAVPALSLLPLASASALSLTGATLFSADSTGAAAPPDVWNTIPADASADLWFQQTGAFINGPTDALAGISIPLTSGTYTYNLYGAANNNMTSYDGINLFFNDSSTPSISAFGPTQTGLTPSTFAADSATTVGQTNDNMTPGTGALTYSQGGITATLTGFTWANPSVYNRLLA